MPTQDLNNHGNAVRVATGISHGAVAPYDEIAVADGHVVAEQTKFAPPVRSRRSPTGLAAMVALVCATGAILVRVSPWSQAPTARESGSVVTQGASLDSSMSDALGNAGEKPVEAHGFYTEYPKGEWRLVSLARLAPFAIWVSHILVRHREADPQRTPLSNGDWFALGPPPSRTREEALERAKRVAAEAREDPTSFTRLGGEFSDDSETRARGGSLGGVSAGQWALTAPSVLDAVLAINPGEVSTVVETEYGFHVFLRRFPPKPRQIAARRIVIGHDRATFLKFASRGGSVQRSREEALAISRQLVAQARSNPTGFSALVAKYSEHRDAAQGGDIGVWSNAEASLYARELEVIDQLTEGEISEPIDCQFGYQIFQRTQVAPRGTYAMTAIALPLSLEPSPSEATTADAARRGAMDLIREVAENPARFTELQRQYGGTQFEQWSEGRGDYRVTNVVKQLHVGGVARTPLELDGYLMIPKRVAPRKEALEATARFTLPDPFPPNVDVLLRELPHPTLLSLVKDLRAKGPEALSIDDRLLPLYGQVHDQLLAKFAGLDTPSQRSSELKTAWVGASPMLSAKLFEAYVGLLVNAIKLGAFESTAERGGTQ